MLKNPWLLRAMLVVAVFALSTTGCGSDDPAGPGGGGGGGGTVGSKIAAGVYDITLSQWTCGMTDTATAMLEQVACADFTFDELFELSCPVVISNNSFTIDCTFNEDDGFCSYTQRVQATGTLVGNTWTITGTVTTTNENPPGCSGEAPCYNVRVVVEMVSGTPSACTYADANTVEATVSGGPLAGNTDFVAMGSSFGGPGAYSWSIFAGAGTGFTPKQGSAALNSANLALELQDLDENSLPATFTIAVTGGGASSSSPLARSSSLLPSGSAYYYDQTTAGAYFYSTGGTGSITVNEVSDNHIAGTINSLAIQGMTMPAGGGTPTPGTRSITGGFHVRQDTGFSANRPATGKSWFTRMLTEAPDVRP